MIKYRLDFAEKYLNDAIDIDQHNLEQLLKAVKQVMDIIDEKGGR